MKLIKKFEEFIYGGGAAQPAPATKPTTTPTRPGKPAEKPGRPAEKPGRPSPIRRDKPAVKPDTKAEVEKELPTATIEDVMQRFANLTDQKI